MEAVKENIDRIDDGFRDYMHTIGCEGAIVLHAPEDKFDEFGIKIMVHFFFLEFLFKYFFELTFFLFILNEPQVQFRKPGKLQHLKGMTQSGGEKSVATMLYLVSLQPLTPCPFRLVDEINQGMDARNERMIFEQGLHFFYFLFFIFYFLFFIFYFLFFIFYFLFFIFLFFIFYFYFYSNNTTKN